MALKKQMEMFEDGGLKDEGGTVDPESGNEVPVGSTQEEVRDDIPAQLSEGEFVLPADVVRYHGLDKIMALRDEAKMGLQRMEAMGQMGNSDEATIPDGVPFDINDLDIDDTLEYNQGGVVMQPGFTGIQTTQPSQFQNYQGQYTPYQPAAVPQAASQQYVAPTYTPPTQAVTPVMQQQQLPQFENFISTPTGAYDELREYRNETTGEVRKIPFVGGEPIYPIPEGFVFVDPEAVATEEVTTTPTTPQTTRVTQQDKDGRDDRDTPSSGATMSFGGTANQQGTVSGAISGELSYSGIPDNLGFGFGAIAKSILGKGEPVQLKEDQTATVTNFKKVEGVQEVDVFAGHGVRFDREDFNRLNKLSVTKRQEVADVLETAEDRLKNVPDTVFEYKDLKAIHDLGDNYGRGEDGGSFAGGSRAFETALINSDLDDDTFFDAFEKSFDEAVSKNRRGEGRQDGPGTAANAGASSSSGGGRQDGPGSETEGNSYGGAETSQAGKDLGRSSGFGGFGSEFNKGGAVRKRVIAEGIKQMKLSGLAS